MATVRCHKIEEILASKLTTLLHRRKAIDLFDLLYSIVFRNEFPINRLEVVATFLKKSIFEPYPHVAKSQLLALPLDEFKQLWSTIVAPVSSLMNCDYVVANFRSLIELLFGLMAQPSITRLQSFGGAGRGVSLRAPGQPATAYASPSYFSWDVRNAIVTAGRAGTLVEFVYRGWRRLVEPYKIQYYVRKKDGVGSEYFWGYDTTGGKTGPSLKSFFCDQIESARVTNIQFHPRAPIEL